MTKYQSAREHSIIGCGYVGRQLVQLLIPAGIHCRAIVRSQTSIQSLPLQAWSLDLDQAPQTFPYDLTNSGVYYFAPPPGSGERDPRLQRFLQFCTSAPPRKIVYISTSGVYGDCQGDWVDENRKINPATGRARRRAHAEQQLNAFVDVHNTTRLVILRVGGIYGPGRIPVLRASQSTVICPQEAPYSNRIHVQDLAQICLHAMQHDIVGVFNVADGHPTSMTDYFYQIADRAGLRRPKCVPLAQASDALSPGMLSFVRESRRLVVSKLLSTFAISLKYPTLQAGLDSCAEDFIGFLK